MPQTPNKLLADALKLPVKQRAYLVEELLASLEENDDLDSVIDEAERRWQRYKDGKIKGIPVEEIFPELGTSAKKA